MSSITSVLKSLADRWPSTMVARGEVERFSGGLVTSRYLANLDSLSLGPSGRFRVGRKIAYPVENLIEWIEDRAEACKSKGTGNGN